MSWELSELSIVVAATILPLRIKLLVTNQDITIKKNVNGD